MRSDGYGVLILGMYTHPQVMYNMSDEVLR